MEFTTHYVGRTSQPKKRWPNHKSHIRHKHLQCNLASHCSRMHRDDMVGQDKLQTTADIRKSLRFTLLEALGPEGDLEELKRLEGIWRDRLESWDPVGLNTRDD